MMNRGNYIIVCLLLSLTGLMQEGHAQEKSKQPTYDFLPLQAKIQTWVDSGYYSGASVIVVKDNKTIYKKHFGDFKPQTVVFIASAGKWLAAAAIARLVDKRILSWDDQVKKWIPALTGEKGEATLAQLFSHTSGYPDYQPKHKPVDIYQSLKESVAHIIDLPAAAAPGTEFRYGGLAMNVAGRMAEIATGKDWETIFQESIAVPLAMRSTRFTPVDSSGGHAPMLGGGARSTLQDYANFLSMISNGGVFQGKRVLSGKSIAYMQADHVMNAKVGPGEFVNLVRGSMRKDIYGLGEWREETVANGEAMLISSPSWAGAYPWIDRKNNLYGFFLAHINKARNGFSSFIGSPVLPYYVRDAIEEYKHPEIKRGYIKVDSGRLYYEEMGKGPPLIFIHGHSFDHSEWKPQLNVFAKKFRVITYDVRGYGRSSMPVEFSKIMHADDLLTLMDRLGIRKAHLAGLSMGGFISLDFLALHQDRVLSATLASGDIWTGSPGPTVPWNDSSIAKRRQEISELYKNGIDEYKRNWFNALTTRNGEVIGALREPVWQMIYKWDAWQPTHVEPRFLLGTSVVERLSKMNTTVPVLVLTGELETNRKSRLPQYIPTAREERIPGAGHVSNLENPDVFNRILFDFLQQVK